MRIVDGYADLDGDARGASAAIGNFDGVHRGHQVLISDANATLICIGRNQVHININGVIAGSTYATHCVACGDTPVSGVDVQIGVTRIQHAAQIGVDSVEVAIESAMQDKAKEFRDSGAEVYRKV